MSRHWFYKSSEWIKCKDAYMSSVNWICERCGKPATICHHTIYLDNENVHNPEIALNWDLLEAVCHDCHNQEHFKINSTRDGLSFDENGNLKKEIQK